MLTFYKKQGTFFIESHLTKLYDKKHERRIHMQLEKLLEKFKTNTQSTRQTHLVHVTPDGKHACACNGIALVRVHLDEKKVTAYEQWHKLVPSKENAAYVFTLQTKELKEAIKLAKIVNKEDIFLVTRENTLYVEAESRDGSACFKYALMDTPAEDVTLKIETKLLKNTLDILTKLKINHFNLYYYHSHKPFLIDTFSNVVDATIMPKRI